MQTLYICGDNELQGELKCYAQLALGSRINSPKWIRTCHRQAATGLFKLYGSLYVTLLSPCDNRTDILSGPQFSTGDEGILLCIWMVNLLVPVSHSSDTGEGFTEKTYEEINNEIFEADFWSDIKDLWLNNGDRIK